MLCCFIALENVGTNWRAQSCFGEQGLWSCYQCRLRQY
ncbi:Uncharacterised protein [Burkholderia pseudomallei]|nr:Uncharacterised protein [Burkholderia pseudomallei]CAJ9604570.1 Uncharacterised protein [Burkholderia pseudomallei]VCH03338.1 Uncharacterised protein [Burkholderia pseudomallei]VCH27370.1 Uncharacterised protein [Burkholderia pseudomallei]VCH32272.1 Uncharacterised protein [Burkholderia pseudomallei]